MKTVKNKTMKKNFLLLMLTTIIVIAGCKKNEEMSSPSAPETKQTRLTAYYENDTLVYRYYYGSNKKISKREYYLKNGTLFATTLYTYDSDAVIEKLETSGAKFLYTKNENGQIKQRLYYDGGGNFKGSLVYAYDPVDKKKLIRNATLSSLGIEESYRLYTYNGSIASQKLLFSHTGAGLPVLTGKIDYEHTGDYAKQAQLLNLITSMSEQEITEDLFLLTGDKITYTFYGSGGNVTSKGYYTGTLREYDTNGNVLKQRKNYISLVPSLTIETINTRYEYTQL